jgi:hypothetical protein
MVRGWTLSILFGATLAVGTWPADAAVPREAVERGPAPRLERPSETTTAAVDELLELSGLRAQLDALAAGIRVQLQAASGRLSAQDLALVDRIAARHFDAGMLHARIRLELGRHVDAARLTQALEWYRSPLGRRITRAEVAAIGAERDTIPWPSENRIALVQELDERTGAAETALDVAMALARSLARAAAPVRPVHLRLSPEQFEARLAQARTEALAPTRIACLQNMLFSYRGLTDAELAEYVRFVDSRAGQWYVTTLNQALIDAASMAAEFAAGELVTLLPNLSGDLR